ncbi:MAG: hypothetical protein K0R69_928 [Clostridia bacterium]|jgi:hypothetical protein|nr:hypothetical protein [Clostridia bacterium]
MKKKIVAMLMASLMMLGATGCSTEGLNLYKEIEKTSTWEYEATKGDMTVSVEAEDEEVNIKASFTGYTNTKEMQAYVDINIDEISIGTIEAPIKISPVKVYVDKSTVYISKAYFTDLFAASGAPVPEAIKAIETEYIGIDTAGEMQAGAVDKEKAQLLFEKLFKDSEVKVPIAQKGRSYTMKLDSSQMVDLSVQFISEMMSKIDVLNEYSDTGITQEEVDAQKEETLLALNQGKEAIKPMVNGSDLKVTYTFEDDSYTQAIDMGLKVAAGEAPVIVKLNVSSEGTKAVKKDITLPTSKVVYSMDEFMELFFSGSASAVRIAKVDLNQAITEKNETYIPFRAAMDDLGYAVKYSPQTKKSVVIINEEEVAVSTITKNGISYIALSQLDEIGFYTSKNEEYIVVEDVMY